MRSDVDLRQQLRSGCHVRIHLAGRERTVRSVLAMAATTLMVFGSASSALASPPVTETTVERFTESFSEVLLCHDEIYDFVADVQVVERFTAAGIDEDGNFILPLHFHFSTHGQIVAVPQDGTGATYTGRFSSSDLENIRDVKQGEVFVETDTDLARVDLTGSDGSTITMWEHRHFTVTANGDMSVVFEQISASC